MDNRFLAQRNRAYVAKREATGRNFPKKEMEK